MTARCSAPSPSVRTAAVWTSIRSAALAVRVMRWRSSVPSRASTVAGSSPLAAASSSDPWQAVSGRTAPIRSAAAQRLRRRTMPRFMSAPSLCIELSGDRIDPGEADAQAQGRYDEEAEKRRRDDATQDDGGHRAHDLEAGDAAEDKHRHGDERYRQRREEDRPEAIARPAQDELPAEGVSPLELPIVADQEDAVARGQPEHRNEAEVRAERERSTVGQHRQHSAGDRHRKGEEGQRRQAPGAEGRLEEEKHPDRRRNPDGDQAARGLPLGSQHLWMELE